MTEQLSPQEISDLDREKERLNKKRLAKKPDELYQQEIDAQEKEKKRLENKGLEQDIEQRKEYAAKIYTLIVFWLVAVFILITLSGVGAAFGWFKLSTTVLTTIIGGTTINVLGIFYIVANYLFYRSK